LAALAGAICCASSLAVLGAASAQATPTASGSSVSANPWGKPIEIPGIGALEKGGGSFTNSISCVSPGNCAAAGSYADAPDGTQGFVVSESKGHWGKAIAVPGLVALDKAREVETIMISCGTAGKCAAGGTFLDAKDNEHAFVASEKNGTWGNAIEIPNLGTLNKGGNVDTVKVGCVSAGNCVAGGEYLTAPGEDSATRAFVASENKGAWGKATQLPGLSTLNHGSSVINAISCTQSGRCAADGTYEARSGAEQGFVVSQK
jgi:hypothetical protein